MHPCAAILQAAKDQLLRSLSHVSRTEWKGAAEARARLNGDSDLWAIGWYIMIYEKNTKIMSTNIIVIAIVVIAIVCSYSYCHKSESQY